MYDFLKSAEKNSKFESWKFANSNIIEQIEGPYPVLYSSFDALKCYELLAIDIGVLKVRAEAARLEKKRIEEEEFKKIQEKIKIRERKKELERMAAAVERSTHMAAEAVIRQKEVERQAEEKIDLLKRTFAGEEKRNRWWAATAVVSVILIAAICALVSVWYILVGAIVVVLIIAGVLVYKAYHFPIVEPLVVEEIDLQEQIVQLQQKMKVENEQMVKEKDAKFALQLKKEKKEMKKRKKLLKEKEKYEAELLEQSRLQRIAVAQEALRRTQQIKEEAARSKEVGKEQKEVGSDEENVRQFSDDDVEAARSLVGSNGDYYPRTESLLESVSSAEEESGDDEEKGYQRLQTQDV